MSVDTAQAFFERASLGAYRGSGRNPYVPQQFVQQFPVSGYMTDQNSPARGVVVQPRVYNHASDRRLGDFNTHSPHDIHLQCQYLAFLASRETNKELNEKELLEKEAFRKRLEKIVQNLVAEYAKDHVSVNPKSIRLKCYGSLASGFAVPGSDMDLLLMFPNDQGPVGPIEVESRRMIEKACLDLGYGARLLTKTRVPILRVCQSPNPELLANLKKEREIWEDETKQEEKEKLLLGSGLDPNRLPSDITGEQSDAATATFAELDTEPSIIPLPASPVRVHANLEYTSDVGIQCDINFSNYVAIHNTTLLRCYCKCDPRVRPMGVFVKEWSKARKINTPYHGTLSSYGYIMMVLHYLMNIADPPVIPNLQHLARDEDAWNNRTTIELFEGFDVRFLRNEAMLEKRAQAGQMTKNRESLGSLLRGFFRYYTDCRGFHWVNDVISIRTQGGLLTKKSKEWTEAKRAEKDKSVRLRYLFAIEDPFETDHNIARTVGHSGIVAIRDELRRAWNILSRIQHTQGCWLWYKDNGEEGDDLFTKANNRGDLLRQDQEYHKEKMRKLRETERKREVESRSAKDDNDASVGCVAGRFQIPSNSNDSQGCAKVSDQCLDWTRSKLINSRRAVQGPQAMRNRTLPRNAGQESRDSMDKQTRTDFTSMKTTTENDGCDVSEWIVSTAKANDSSKRDAVEPRGASQTRLVGNSSQKINELEQETSGPAGSSTNPHSKPDATASKPHSAVDCKQSAPATVISETKRCLTIDPKNPLSAWNVTLRDGRWLVWRDEKIRAGIWRGITRWPLSILDRQYPYNAARPSPDFEQQNRVANVRAKRTQYFDLQKAKGETSEARESHESKTTNQERKDSAVSMGKPLAASVCKPKCGAQSGPGKRYLRHLSAHGNDKPNAPSTSAFTLALSSDNSEVIHNPEPKTDLTVKDSLVPTCDPNPRDYRKDFPIPTAADFQFDPAQLRDLGIIAKGGSGCARDAMEQQYGAYDYDGFRNVELSNEWGGGGRMGEMVTDSGEQPLLEVASIGAKVLDGLEGRGDQEGLLRELPADW
jgi:terminal uridylyltransferase